jgi:prevent-host-death family protein
MLRALRRGASRFAATVGEPRAHRLCDSLSRGSEYSCACGEPELRLYLVILYGGAQMKYSDQIRPISYLKANTAEILRRLAERGEPLIITQNGVAKAVVQDIATYEQTQETMALLKILALGNRQIHGGKIVPANVAIKRLRKLTARD